MTAVGKRCVEITYLPHFVWSSESFADTICQQTRLGDKILVASLRLLGKSLVVKTASLSMFLIARKENSR